jgi:hypothetical protein
MAPLIITEITRNKNARQNYTVRTQKRIITGCKELLIACGLLFRSLKVLGFMGNPLIAGFVEIQHDIKSPAWSGKMTEGQASPSDCHNSAKKMTGEDA